MKILVFGATGATGYHVISQGIEKGHVMTGFVRDPSKLKIKHKNLSLFKGDVSNAQQVEEACKDQDAVVSVLGASTPFKRNLTLIKGIENIVNAMMRLSISRFIYQSFLGVNEYRADLGFLMDRIVPIILQNVIKDHEAKEQIITKSNLQWTIARCSMLTNGAPTGKFIHGERITAASPLPSISRADVADFMIQQVNERTYINKKPRIMSR